MFVLFLYEKNIHCIIRMSFHGHLGHEEVDLINYNCIYLRINLDMGSFFKGGKLIATEWWLSS